MCFKNEATWCRHSYNAFGSLKSELQYVLSNYETLNKLGFEYVAVNLTKGYIDVLRHHIPSSAPNDFRRLLERARVFRDGFDRLETLHTMKLGQIIGFASRPSLPKGFSSSDLTEFIAALSALEKDLFPFLSTHYRSALDLKHSYNGRGIVFAVGNRHAQMVVANIKLLRSLDCNLPVEIFYNDENDLSPKNRELLKKLFSVETRNIQLLIDDTSVKVSGWALKPFAVLFSRFTEVILLDADAVFLQNPSILFNDPDYQRARALFYYDRMVGGRTEWKIKWLSNILPKPWSKRLTHANRIMAGLSHENQESGVVVIDKFARFPGLLLTCKLNSIKERDSVTYKISWGDKESFSLAQKMIDHDYAFDPHLTGAIGVLERDLNSKENRTTICGTQIVHFDKQGRIIWFNQFVLLDKYTQSQTLANFEHHVREPGIYRLKSYGVYCLRVEGKASRVRSDEQQLIFRLKNYWSEANNILKH